VYAGPLHGTEACYGGELYDTPIADGCCTTTLNGAAVETMFIDSVTGDVVVRARNRVDGGQGATECKEEDGTTTCTGSGSASNCFYGPLGFGAPGVQTGTGYPQIYITSGESDSCAYRFLPTKEPNSYGNVDGDNPHGLSCCANGDGQCWAGSGNPTGDPLCSSCGSTQAEAEVVAEKFQY